MAGRNRKVQFTKGGHAAKTKTRTRVKTIVVRRSSPPARRTVTVARRRRHKSSFLGGGVIGRLMPDAPMIEGGIAGGIIGWVAKGFKSKDANSVAFKIGDSIPKLTDAGGFVGNFTIALQGLAAVTNHPYARAAARAGVTISLYEYMKRPDSATVTGDTVDGWPDDDVSGRPDDDVSGDGEQTVEGYVNPEDYDQAA